MTKTELIARIIKKNRHLYIRDVKQLVSIVFEGISDALERGDRVEFRNLGTFSVRYREPRAGRNPRTGESVLIPAKAVPFFKTGRQLHNSLNAADTPDTAKTASTPQTANAADTDGADDGSQETSYPASSPQPATTTTENTPVSSNSIDDSMEEDRT